MTKEMEIKLKETMELLDELLACKNKIALPIEKEEEFYQAISEIRSDLEQNDPVIYANFAVNLLHRIAKVPFYDPHYPAWVADLEIKTKTYLA